MNKSTLTTRMRIPFMYVFNGSLTNKKRRQVDGTLFIFNEAPFLAQSLQVACTFPVTVKVDPFSGPFRISVSLLSTLLPTPLFPAHEYPAGTKINVSVRLVDNVNVGRKRPRFSVALNGTNMYEVPV